MFASMNKVLVTGGCGFIGSHITDALIEKGYEVVVIDDLSATSNSEFYYNDKAQYYAYDICDYEKIHPLFDGVYAVFHLAARSRIQPSIRDPRATTKVNVLGTCNVLQAAREHLVDRVVYSSTSSAYGLVNPPPPALREDMPRDCLTPYSVTKCAGEDMCSMYTALFGLQTVILRYFNVYGARQPLKGQYAPVIGLFLEQKKHNQPLTIVGNGRQRRDFTHVSDVVRANIACLETTNRKVFGELFNVGTGVNTSILEIAELIDAPCEFLPPRRGEAAETLANCDKIHQRLGWKAQIEFVDWLKNQL
jgi:UDP-glucose 4-epimerase